MSGDVYKDPLQGPTMKIVGATGKNAKLTVENLDIEDIRNGRLSIDVWLLSLKSRRGETPYEENTP